MEISLSRTQEISLDIFRLLDNNYDCLVHLMKSLRDTEEGESRIYHIEQSKNRHRVLSTYSFLFTLLGYPFIKIHKQKHKQQMELDRESRTLDSRETPGSCQLWESWMIIDKYESILRNPGICNSQKERVRGMIKKRVNRLITTYGKDILPFIQSRCPKLLDTLKI